MADFENDLILVTCASGRQAAHLIPLLSRKWKRIRLAAHSENSQKGLEEKWPQVEVVVGDMSFPPDAARLMKGVTAVYHVGPSLHQYETECGYYMIDAAIREAREGNFKHFVLSSVISTQLRKLMNHDCKRYVEEYLMESGLNYTILQPSHYMDMIPVEELLKQDEPVHTMMWNPDTRFCYTALKDLAEASAVVFEQREKHYFATYPIISTRPVSEGSLVEAIGKAMGKPIRIEHACLEQAVAGASKWLLGRGEVDARRMDILERLLLYYGRRGLMGNSNVAEWILGRKATDIETFAESRVRAARQ
jgi:uncharacterized protein YbjT (DUF2867 family)